MPKGLQQQLLLQDQHLQCLACPLEEGGAAADRANLGLGSPQVDDSLIPLHYGG